MSKKESALFDTLYEGCEETIKAMRKPLAKRSLKRKFRSGWDDAQAKIESKKQAIEDEFAKVKDCEMQRVIELKGDIRTLTEVQEDLATEYTRLFNEVFNADIE